MRVPLRISTLRAPGNNEISILRTGISYALCLLLLLLACGCRDRLRPAPLTIHGSSMGTTFTVKVVTDEVLSRERQKTVREVVDQALQEVDTKMSTYLPDSELSRFNRHRSADPYTLSGLTFAVFELAQQVSAASNGAFDITVGPLVHAWGFGSEAVPPQVPSSDEIARLLVRTGYKKLELDADARTVSKALPEIYCDLSAIAKGFGVDLAAEALERLAIEDYMVEVGGEVRTRGSNADGRPWQLAIEQPAAKGRSVHRILALSGSALATSGDYRNYYLLDGRRISHTIDPRTGQPIDHGLASVSVVHPSCALADAFATALLVLGPEEGYELAVERSLAALFLVREDDGSFTESMTPELARIVSGN